MKKRSGKSHSARYSVGIDEVGRGPLAGPVVVCAVQIDGRWEVIGDRKLGNLRDSKKLSARQREAWFRFFKTHPKIRYVLARVYPREIERRNISQAANLAAHHAFGRLTKSYKLTAKNSKIFLDGGLYIKNKLHSTALGAKTIIKGDEKIPAISIASIIAKVTRDRMMVRLARAYPQYGFEKHKGYGTRAHLAALRKFGPSKVHRKTFLL